MMTSKSQKAEGTAMAKDNDVYHRKAYAACMFCPCTMQWEIKAIFLCRKDAACHCNHKMREPLKFNKPIEYWHVKEFELVGGHVVWGCECAQQPDDLGAPSCV